MTRHLLLQVLTFLGGFVAGCFFVVQDEILTLAMYCGRDCRYPYPFIGSYGLYDAEIIAVGMVLVGLLVFVAAQAHVHHISEVIR